MINAGNHVGRLLISKPGYEHSTRHIDRQPDIVTIFEFKKSFYETILLDVYGNKLPGILMNNDMHSLMVNNTPALEYQHLHILQKINSQRKTCAVGTGCEFAALYR